MQIDRGASSFTVKKALEGNEHMARGRVLKLVCTLTGTALFVALIAVLVYRGYQESWTGFSSYVNAEGKTVPPKRLWDWLTLLIVPLFLAFAAWVLNNSWKAADQRIEADRQRQKSLNDYLAWITELVLEGHLDSQKNIGEGRILARTRTLSVLRTLDGDRKAQILQFLYEAGMLHSPPKISLLGADFRGAVLNEATLVSVEIRGCYFCDATFRDANLRDADFRGCDFTRADLTNADLTGANFKQAFFNEATLIAAKLTGTNLEDADLSRAKLPAQNA